MSRGIQSSWRGRYQQPHQQTYQPETNGIQQWESHSARYQDYQECKVGQGYQRSYMSPAPQAGTPGQQLVFSPTPQSNLHHAQRGGTQQQSAAQQISRHQMSGPSLMVQPQSPGQTFMFQQQSPRQGFTPQQQSPANRSTSQQQTQGLKLKLQQQTPGQWVTSQQPSPGRSLSSQQQSSLHRLTSQQLTPGQRLTSQQQRIDRQQNVGPSVVQITRNGPQLTNFVRNVPQQPNLNPHLPVQSPISTDYNDEARSSAKILDRSQTMPPSYSYLESGDRPGLVSPHTSVFPSPTLGPNPRTSAQAVSQESTSTFDSPFAAISAFESSFESFLNNKSSGPDCVPLLDDSRGYPEGVQPVNSTTSSAENSSRTIRRPRGRKSKYEKYINESTAVNSTATDTHTQIQMNRTQNRKQKVEQSQVMEPVAVETPLEEFEEPLEIFEPVLDESMGGTAAGGGGPSPEETEMSVLNIPQSPHLEEEVTEVGFSCTVCPQTFVTPVGLEEHKKFHLANSGFPCNTCGKTFKQEAKLSSHSCQGTESARKKRKRRNVEALLDSSLVESHNETTLSEKVEKLGRIGKPRQEKKENVEEEEEEEYENIGQIVESVEIDVPVIEMNYEVKFLEPSGVAIETGNLAWLEEDLDLIRNLEEGFRETVEVEQVLDDYTVWCEDTANIVIKEELKDWIEEVTLHTGLTHVQVKEAMEAAEQMETNDENGNNQTLVTVFPWQKIPSKYQQEQEKRNKEEEERKTAEAAAMWKLKAQLMDCSPSTTDTSSLVSSKMNTDSDSPALVSSRSSSVRLSNFAYFNNDVVEAGSGDDSDEEDWCPDDETRLSCGLCKKTYSTRNHLNQHMKTHTRDREKKNDTSKMLRDANVGQIKIGPKNKGHEKIGPGKVGQENINPEKEEKGKSETGDKRRDIDREDEKRKPIILHSTLT